MKVQRKAEINEAYFQREREPAFGTNETHCIISFFHIGKDVVTAKHINQT